MENEFEKRFANSSNDELVEAYNSDIDKPSVVGARLRFHAAICKEFDKRGFEQPTGRINNLVKKNN